MKKLFLVFAAVLFLFEAGFSQSRVERKANEYYDGLAFAKAIPWYQRALEKEQKDEYIFRLADCYRRIHKYEEAAKWYARAMELDWQPPATQFHYAHSLLLKGDFEGAKRNFRQYSLVTPGDPRGKYFAEGIELVEKMIPDSVFFTLTHLPFNTENTEFGATPYAEGIIIASSRIEGTRTIVRNFQWKDTPFLNLIYHKLPDSATGEWDKGETLSDAINSKFHESNFTWSPNSENIYFTRNNFLKRKGMNEEGIILLKIYYARMEGFKIGEVKEFQYNSDEYSVTHPSLSPDGNKLYFVSDMPGGQGGKDIYYCNKQGEGWSKPINLGNSVNTTGDEVFPFIHEDGTLYFSSDGHPGLGFLDVFKIDLNSSERRVVNLGYPINSSWDDFAIWMNSSSDTGYVSSNRPGGAGDDDIYQFTIRRPEIEILVLDSVAQLPLENAEITVRNKTLNSEEVFTTDSWGMVRFPAEFGAEYEGIVRTEEFDPETFAMNTSKGEPRLLYSFEVQLYNPPPAITAIVIDQATKERLPDTRVDIVKRITNDTIVRNTDRNGRFAVKLEPSTYYTISVRRKGYFTYSQNVSTTQTSFEGDTIIPLRMVPIELNKPIVLENIHYDFDKWTLRPEAYGDLNKVATLMRDNPELIVELSSHTDSRGSDNYNERLSRRRASSARLYLLQSGIEPQRIKAVGYGEKKPVNRCTNGVPCSEDEHFANRRTEFKVIGMIEGIDMDNSVLETDESGNPPPKYNPVDPKNIPPSTPEKEKLPVRNPDKLPVNSQPSENAKSVNNPDTGGMPLGEKSRLTEEEDPTPEVKEEEENSASRFSGWEDSEGKEQVSDEPEEEKEDVVAAPETDSRELATKAVSNSTLVIEEQYLEFETPAQMIPDQETIVSEPAEKNDTPPSNDGGNDPEISTISSEEKENTGSSNLDLIGDEVPEESAEESSVSSAPAEEADPRAKRYTPPVQYDLEEATQDPKVRFRIHMGSFNDPLPGNGFSKLGPLQDFIIRATKDGKYHYYLGDYREYKECNEALKYLKTKGYPGAYITAFKNSAQLSFSEMMAEMAK